MQQLVGNTVEVQNEPDSDEDLELGFKPIGNADKNKLVVCSIHQPSSEVFACFSHVILMQEGRIAFQGTVHEAENFFLRLISFDYCIDIKVYNIVLQPWICMRCFV